MTQDLPTPSIWSQTEYKYQLDLDIKITDLRPLFQSKDKVIHEISWINQRGPSVVLLQINGPTAEQEASLYLRFSNHPNIVKTLGSVRNDSNLVMLLQERAPKPDLSQMLLDGTFKPTEEVLCTIFKQICKAMICLANANVVHGDLGCRNVLVFQSDSTKPEKNLVKLTDFGLAWDSRITRSRNSSTTIIPIRFAAPEVLQRQVRRKYAEKSDVYSMIVLIWEACSYGAIPYASVTNDDDVRRKKLNDERLPRPLLCGDELWAIMNAFWDINPRNRPNFQSLKQQISNLNFQSNSQLNQQSIPNRPFQSPFPCLPPIVRDGSSHANTQKPIPAFSRVLSRYDQSSARVSVIDNEAQSQYRADDFEQGSQIEGIRESDTGSSCRNRPIPCQFCDQIFQSRITLSEHLLMCANKTKYPTSRRFRARESFNYHVDNNCVNSDYADAISNRLDERITDLSSEKSNKKTIATNRSYVREQDNPIIPAVFNHRKRIDVGIQTSASNRRISRDNRNEIVQDGYRAGHVYLEEINDDLRNPVRISDRERRPRPALTNRSQARSPVNGYYIPRTPAYLPCETCNKPIEQSNYFIHTVDCRARDKRRTEALARKMSREPTREPIPCEFCHELYPGNKVSSHQANCPQNPNYIASIPEPHAVSPIPIVAPPSPHSDSFELPTISRSSSQTSTIKRILLIRRKIPSDRASNDRRRLAPKLATHPYRYFSSDLDREHLPNGPHMINRSTRRNNGHQSRENQEPIDLLSSESRDTSSGDFVYEITRVLPEEHLSYGAQGMASQSNTNAMYNKQQERCRPAPPLFNNNNNTSNSTYLTNGDFNDAEKRTHKVPNFPSSSIVNDNTRSTEFPVRNNGESEERIRLLPPRTSNLRERKKKHRCKYCIIF